MSLPLIAETHVPFVCQGSPLSLRAAHTPVRFLSNLTLTYCLFLLLQELPRYLAKIVPPILACFTDQDARVRYYACEAMYNIAKVAKGEILVYFNNIFDQLCKVCEPVFPLAPLSIPTIDLTGFTAWCRLRALGEEWR